MSRINEAMRRAGQADDNDPARRDEDLFVSGEATSAHPPLDPPPVEPEAPPFAVNALPVRAHAVRSVARIPPAIPIDVRSTDEKDQIEVRDVIRILISRWKSITAVIAAALILAAAYNAYATPIYQARARLVIEPDATQIVPFRTATEDTNRFDYLGTQLDILRSRDLALRTLKRMNVVGPNATPADWQVSELTGSLTVSVAGNVASRTVNVSIVSSNPEWAARMANGLAETYVAQNLDIRRQGNRDAAKWLSERLAELKQQVSSSASALQRYREQKDAVSLDEKQNIDVQKLTQLNAAAAAARAEAGQKRAVYEELTELQKRGAPLDTFPAVMANGFVMSLKGELAGLQRKRQQMAESLLDGHPDMVKIDTEIATTTRKLNDEIGKVVESIRNDYRVASASEQALTNILGQQKRTVIDLNAKAIPYGDLQRDATSSQQIYETVLQRLKEAELAAELQTNNVRILDRALLPGSPILPRKRLNLAIAFVLGTFLAFGLAIMLEYVNPRITRANDVENSLGVPLLGIAPKIPSMKKGRPRVDSLPPQFQEAIRGIRTRIMLSAAHGDVRTLAVTSTVPKEGKTVVASSLAASIAMTGRRVLLLDGDLHRPQVHKIFGVPIAPGVGNVLAGTAKPSDALIESSISGLFVMPAGDRAEAGELLDTGSVTRLVQGLGQVFDVVVLDSPPVMALADASIVANVADSVVFVVGSGVTNSEAVRAAIERLTSVQAHVIGVVLNNAKVSRGSAYGYHYYEAEEPV